MPIEHLVQGSPITVSADSTVMEAIRVMVDRRIGAVVVTEDAKVVGIFTERDVMKKIVLGGMDAAKTLISQVMTTEVKSVPRDVSVHRAVEIMKKHHIRHLPIVNDRDQLLGVVSLRHLLYDMVDDLENQTNSLASYLTADGIGG